MAAEQGTGMRGGGVGRPPYRAPPTETELPCLTCCALNCEFGQKDLDVALQSPLNMLSPLTLLTEGNAMGQGQQLQRVGTRNAPVCAGPWFSGQCWALLNNKGTF